MGGKVGGVGAALLTKLGWKEGTGLGANGDGRTEPVRPGRSRKRQNEGLGRRKIHEDRWWEKMMNDAYGASTSASSDGKKDVDIFEACEGRRCRPHGTAKLARLDAHERKLQSQLKPSSVSCSDDTEEDIEKSDQPKRQKQGEDEEEPKPKAKKMKKKDKKKTKTKAIRSLKAEKVIKKKDRKKMRLLQ